MIDAVFSQTGVVLFSSPPGVAQLQECFSYWNPTLLEVKQSAESEASLETFNGPGVSVQADPGRESRMDIDIQTTPWPDDLGDGPTPGMVQAAAIMGAYGAHTRPGGLARAVAQAWHWPEAAAAVRGHQAFVRIRVRGMLLSEGQAAPASAQEQLSWVLRAAARLLTLPGAIAWYHPAAELLMDEGRFSREMTDATASRRPAVDALISVRVWQHPGWLLMDTAGMQALGLPDMEYTGAVPPVEPGKVIPVFQGLCHYLIANGDIIQSGNTADGPDGKWRALRCKSSVLIPGRPVLRWAGDNEPAPPADLAPVEPETPPDDMPNNGVSDGADAYLKIMADFAVKWSEALPRYHAELARYRQTADFVFLAGVSTGTRNPRQLPKKLERAELIPSFVSIANTNAEMPLRPALVVGTFDRNPEAIALCGVLADRIGWLYDDSPAEDPEDRQLQQIVQDDKYVEGKRTLIPASVTRGFEIYAFNAVLAESPDELATEPGEMVVPLLAVPGPGPAPLVAIPLSVLQGMPGPPVYQRATGEPAPVDPLPPLAKRAPQQSKGCRNAVIVILVIVGIGGLMRLIEGPKPKDSKKGESKSLLERWEEKLEEKKRRNGTP